MKPKERKPLTPELRDLTAEAWHWAQFAIRRASKKWPGPDYSGAVALRLVTLIWKFDCSKSSLPTWSANQARHACLDLQREEIRKGYRRTHDRRDGGPIADRSDEATWGEPTTEDPTADFEVDEAIGRLLRPLPPALRAVFRGSVLEGRSLEEIGAELGVGRARLFAMKNEALARLRERWAAQEESRGPKTAAPRSWTRTHRTSP